MIRISTLLKKITETLPDVVMQIAQRLNYELYAVGGCVRDPLLGRPIGEIDLSVVGDAIKLAHEIADTLKKTSPDDASIITAIYSRFGTALIQLPHLKIEFATARRESYQSDSRKPNSIKPVSIEEDLHRRDFTINTLAIGLVGSKFGQLLDLFNGMSDLRHKIIRTPLQPSQTFSDDPLRMLRAIRFAAEFNFTIAPETTEGIQKNAQRLKIVAAERIADEFLKMLTGSDPVRAMVLLIESGLMALIIPEVIAMSGVEQVGRHHHKDVLIHSLKVMQKVADQSTDPILRLAALLHDVGKPRTKRFDRVLGWTFHGHEVIGARMAKLIGTRLHLGKDDLHRLIKLVRLHMRPINLTSEGVTDSAIRRLLFEAGEHLEEQLILCRADITTANPDKVIQYLTAFDDMVSRMDEVESRDKMRSFQSPIRGEEIMEICCIPPSAYVGALKEQIEDAIIDGEIPFDKDSAREYLLKIKDEILAMPLAKLNEFRKQKARARDEILPNQILDLIDRNP